LQERILSGALVSELRHMARDIRDQGRAIARAQLEALDRLGDDVRVAEVLEIDDSFDRPTSFTRSAIFLQRTKNKVPEVRVGIKDDFGTGQRGAVRWLRPQIEGGSRAQKSFERAIRGLGVMDGTQYIVPGAYAQLDAYGNISRGQLMQILSQLRTFTGAETQSRNLPRDGDYERNRSGRTPGQVRRAAYRRAGGQYFAVGPYQRGGLRPGIYQRQVASRRMVGPASPKPRPVMIFVERVAYEQRFAFWSAGEYAIQRNWPRRLDEALARFAPGRGA
jgi:hypothetical protein